MLSDSTHPSAASKVDDYKVDYNDKRKKRDHDDDDDDEVDDRFAAEQATVFSQDL